MAAFRTNAPVWIAAPVPLDPNDGELVTGLCPVLQIANLEIEGDSGPVTVEFQIATDSQFANTVAVLSQGMGDHPSFTTALPDVHTAHLREQRTSVVPGFDLELETIYFWRARATNGSVETFPVTGAMAVVTGEFSETRSFITPAAAEVVSGGGGGSPGTAEDQLDLSQVVWLHTNVSGWAQTSTITSVSIGNPPICIGHTMSGGWSSIPFSGINVEGNPWVFANIGGTWYAGTYEWIRPGQTCKEISANTIGPHVDSSPLNGWTPQSGDLIGLMVSTPARLGPAGPKNERSNVVLVNWP